MLIVRRGTVTHRGILENFLTRVTYTQSNKVCRARSTSFRHLNCLWGFQALRTDHSALTGLRSTPWDESAEAYSYQRRCSSWKTARLRNIRWGCFLGWRRCWLIECWVTAAWCWTSRCAAQSDTQASHGRVDQLLHRQATNSEIPQGQDVISWFENK